MPRRLLPPLLLFGLLLASSACEVAASFDPKKLETDRTIGPVPLPSVDGAVVNIPDASASLDGALIKPPETDAQLPQVSDAAALDAATAEDAASGELADASSDDAGADAGNDAAASGDISFADAGLD
jgi:hypothetical protein